MPIAFSQKRAGYEYNTARHFYKSTAAALQYETIFDQVWPAWAV